MSRRGSLSCHWLSSAGQTAALAPCVACRAGRVATSLAAVYVISDFILQVHVSLAASACASLCRIVVVVTVSSIASACHSASESGMVRWVARGASQAPGRGVAPRRFLDWGILSAVTCAACAVCRCGKLYVSQY